MRVTLRETRETAVRCLWRLGVAKADRPLAAALLAAAERRGAPALAWLDRCNAAGLTLTCPDVAWAPGDRLDAAGASAVVVGPRALRRVVGARSTARLTHVADPELLAGAPDVAAAWWGAGVGVESAGGETRLHVRPVAPGRPVEVIDVDRPLWERLHGYAQDALLDIERRPDPDD